MIITGLNSQVYIKYLVKTVMQYTQVKVVEIFKQELSNINFFNNKQNSGIKIHLCISF